MPDFGSAFLTALGWVVAGFLGAIPILLLTRWWSEGWVSAAEFFGISFMFVVLFALLMGPISPAAKFVVFLLLALSSVGMPYVVAGLSKRDVKEFEKEKEEMYRAAVASNPGNVAARVELARNLYANGCRNEAIEEMERAIRISPKTTEQEQNLLKRWLKERDAQPDPTMICRWCRQDTPRDRPQCLHCERPTSASREVAQAILEDMPGTLRLALQLLPVIVIGAYLASLMQGIFGNLLILILIVGGLLWFRKRLAF
jgi:tetratricopeptide (TPR) repeat protein